jgi:HSP20 family protein
MSLVKRSDWPTLGGSLLSDFFDDERFFSSPWLRGQHIPAVNVKETEKTFEVELAALGFTKQDLKVSVENNMLTVSAEKKQEQQSNEENYTRREFGYSSFSRSFNLPTNTTEQDVKAKYEDGILKLSISKKNHRGDTSRKAIEIS